MSILDIQQRIVDQVHRLPGRKTSAGESIMVCCPFHDDSSPSAGIFVGVGMEIPLGFFNCLGCGAKGHWNNWAPKAKLEAMPEWELRAATELVVAGRSSVQEDNGSFRRFRSLRQMMEAVGRPAYFPWFEDKDWRGYNGKLLSDFGAQVCMPPGAEEPVCFLPCKIRKSWVGGVAGYLQKEKGRTSYLTTRGTWVKETGLLGYDTARSLIRNNDFRYVTIEEGPRDMYRMLTKGVPSVSALGAKTWSPAKTRLIEMLGVSTAYVISDNDKGGKELRDGIRAAFKESNVKLRMIRLPEEKNSKGKLIKMDPDSAPTEVMDEILDFLESQHGGTKRTLFNPKKLGWEKIGE